MATQNGFEPIRKPRFQEKWVDGIATIIVRARRHWVALPFLCVWISFWTIGGIGAFHGLLYESGERVFHGLWLIFWAVFWCFAASTILWQIAGRQSVHVAQGALVVGWKMPFLSKVKRYDAAAIARVRGVEKNWYQNFSNMMQPSYPPFFPFMVGSVQFDYGGRSVTIMPGLDAAEGHAVAEWIAARLPKS